MFFCGRKKHGFGNEGISPFKALRKNLAVLQEEISGNLDNAMHERHTGAVPTTANPDKYTEMSILRLF